MDLARQFDALSICSSDFVIWAKINKLLNDSVATYVTKQDIGCKLQKIRHICAFTFGSVFYLADLKKDY